MSGDPSGFTRASELPRPVVEVGPLALKAAQSAQITSERANVIRNLLPELSDAEIGYVFFEAGRTKLDPLRQLAAWKDRRSGKVVIHVKIDGLLALAERTGQYRGSLPTRFLWKDGEKFVDLPARQFPEGKEVALLAATCAVRRDGYPEPVEVTRYYSDYAPREIVPGSSWDRMASVMLEKVALAAALRRAFPQDLAGLYEPAETGGEK